MTIIYYLRWRFLWKYIFLKKVNNIIIHTSCCCSFLYSIEVINLSYALSLVLLMVTRRKPQLQWRRHTNNGINKLNSASTLALKFWYIMLCRYLRTSLNPKICWKKERLMTNFPFSLEWSYLQLFRSFSNRFSASQAIRAVVWGLGMGKNSLPCHFFCSRFQPFSPTAEPG